MHEALGDFSDWGWTCKIAVDIDDYEQLEGGEILFMCAVNFVEDISKGLGTDESININTDPAWVVKAVYRIAIWKLPTCMLVETYMLKGES